jgi:hypothetical protein
VIKEVGEGDENTEEDEEEDDSSGAESRNENGKVDPYEECEKQGNDEASPIKKEALDISSKDNPVVMAISDGGVL